MQEAEATVIAQVLAHWFTQGGEARFGSLSMPCTIGNLKATREPENADELVSQILSLSPAPVSPVEPTPEPPRCDCDYPLEASIEDGRLVIAIGVQRLAHATAFADWANPFDEAADDYIRTFAIEDAPQFAEDVVSAMLSERENGSTPLSDFLDTMAQAAIEDGSLGLHEDEQQIKHGTFAPCETWAAQSPAPVSPVEPEPPEELPCYCDIPSHILDLGCPRHQAPQCEPEPPKTWSLEIINRTGFTVEPEPCVWRDISTAPKVHPLQGGSDLLLAWVAPGIGEWVVVVGCWRDGWWSGSDEAYPTLWAPVPRLPGAPLKVEREPDTKSDAWRRRL